MLVAGVCNPTGERDGYNGLYLTASELRDVAKSMRGTPVKAEHSGAALGCVVSSFVDAFGALQCVVRIDDSLEGEITRGLVRDGIASDFSLGYTVDVSQSDRQLKAGKKHVLEVSLVRRGARAGCHVYSYTEDSSETMHVRCDHWECFDMQ